ncbi:isopentenyl-diphosphate Delta-isomerase [Vreelandella andesensis]|uniref:Isopentenyl-diphosphate Delta-isomerase n=2 Tax=Vreelandella andesensis TaxID=447567 RepID=A0A433KFW8_9GAMM|nr:isopentenyl-diphosphate Delta-isomerase [Halomonas andesensis]
MVLTRNAIVSFDNEPLVLVDEHNQVQGYDSKVACHQGQGQLHRAFSVFVFNRHNEVLLQQRSALKPLWPLYWSNSCCSHPRRGEDELASVKRRLKEELSIAPHPEFLYRFRYQAEFADIGAENELCSVYIARSDKRVIVNESEVADCRYIAPEALDRELRENASHYTPWLKLEWPCIREKFWSQVASL